MNDLRICQEPQVFANLKLIVKREIQLSQQIWRFDVSFVSP